MCYQVRFITSSVKCMVTMRWMTAWLGNGIGCLMKDERRRTTKRKLYVHLWWMMIWCVRSTKECATTDGSQFLICPCTFVRFQRLLHDIISSHFGYRKVVQDWCPRCSQRSTKTACCICVDISDALSQGSRQARRSLGRILAPRQKTKLCCLLWSAEEAEACNSKQKARNAECHRSFASL